MKKIKLLFQGDSITDAGRNYGDIHDLGGGYPKYAAKLLAEKFPDVEFIQDLPPVPEKLSQFCQVPLPEPEKTEMGFHVLPDTSGGTGPLYFSLIHKKTMEDGE